MCGLSNIFWWRDGQTGDQPVEIRPPNPLELEPAIRLLLGFDGEKADEATARDFIQYARPRGINLGNMIVAASENHILGCCLPIHSPGKTALIMTSTSGHQPAITQSIADCMQAVIERIDLRQTRLLQLLIEPDDEVAAQHFRTMGFKDLATLIYLQRVITRTIPQPVLPNGFSLIQYNQSNHNLFAQAILASYEKSLDCPDLHGKREIDDIITGHKAAGDFTPDLWFCLIKNQSPVGVLLLSPSAAHSTLELVYIGLSPDARGHHLGDYFVQLALHQTWAQNLRILTLAVDSKNKPATHLYYRNGLNEVHRRHAMMLTLPG